VLNLCMLSFIFRHKEHIYFTTSSHTSFRIEVFAPFSHKIIPRTAACKQDTGKHDWRLYDMGMGSHDKMEKSYQFPVIINDRKPRYSLLHKSLQCCNDIYRYTQKLHESTKQYIYHSNYNL